MENEETEREVGEKGRGEMDGWEGERRGGKGEEEKRAQEGRETEEERKRREAERKGKRDMMGRRMKVAVESGREGSGEKRGV